MYLQNEKSDNKIGYLSLCYHYVRSDTNDPFPRIIGTKEQEFKAQIKMIKDNFEIISLHDVEKFSYENLQFNNEKYKMLITFDDGLFDHYNAAKILNDNEIKATFFIPTCIIKETLPANPMIIHYGIAIYGLEKFLKIYENALNYFEYNAGFDLVYNPEKDNVWKKIQELKSIFKYKLNYIKSRNVLLYIYENLLLNNYPDIIKKIHLGRDQIKEMIEMGHSIGVHTHTHISVSATSLNKDEFYNEMIFPKKYLESEFNTTVNAISYPFGEKKDCLSSIKLLNSTNEYKLAFTVEEIVNFQNTSPFEIGRYQPKGNETVDTLSNTLSNIIEKSNSL
jgi:peptidoglycan/xylan/chitin deacetylase (PgdA/CDA1 family)